MLSILAKQSRVFVEEKEKYVPTGGEVKVGPRAKELAKFTAEIEVSRKKQFGKKLVGLRQLSLKRIEDLEDEADTKGAARAIHELLNQVGWLAEFIMKAPGKFFQVAINVASISDMKEQKTMWLRGLLDTIDYTQAMKDAKLWDASIA